MRVDELEKKLIDQNITIMKNKEDKSKLIQKVNEIKDKYNEIVKQKINL